ncbi:porin family protein [Chitinophaga lutea]
MKKAGILFVLLASMMQAQSQVSVGIRTGYTASQLSVTGGSPSDLGVAEGYMETLHGWHLDLLINAPLGKGFYLQPVIRYITKGSGFKEAHVPNKALSSLYIPEGSRLQLNYLELPLNVVYKLPLGPGVVTAGLGPYAAVGLKGRYHFDIMQDGRSVSQTSKRVQFSTRQDDNVAVVRMHPWDAGANFTLGYEFNSGIMLGANYSMGMTDIDRNRYSATKNRYLGVTLGFLFNREDY